MMPYINWSNIKNIIFDLGGVLLDIDTKRAISAFNKLGINVGKNYTELEKMQLFENFEKGLITVIEFRDKMKQWAGTNPTDEEIDKAWNSMIIDFPAERIKLLLHLKTKYRTFLLSNTNEIHEKYYGSIIKNMTGKSINYLFEKVYFSHHLHLRKPDIEIFHFVLIDGNLLPEETLFIDDFINNIETAKKAGFLTWHLKPEEQLNELLNSNKPPLNQKK